MTILPTAPDAPTPARTLLEGYDPGITDELVGSGRGVREHWLRIGHTLNELGVDELRRRRHESDRLLDEDGVTYNVLPASDGDLSPTRRSRRWVLDPVPAVLPSDEWSTIERAVIQRTELLNLVLADLYGPRALIRSGVIPAELVYADPGFVRAWDQVRIAGPVQLVTSGFDIARAPDGSHVVLADRAQAPSGFGYALENRVVASRVFPSLYRDSEVHRLAPFFRTLRAALQAAAPPGTDDPRIVVLTPGPHSETAFEHAYLARYLGYSLVEGSDLTVRGGKVWLRSLGHLERVDVILRRVDPWYCDPVELMPGSHLGVPGLVDACRRGNVSVINPLGAGAVENPALLAYLPRIAHELFGHDLHLPSVRTWWCGDHVARREALDGIDRHVFKQLTAAGSQTVARPAPVFGALLTTEGRATLRRRIEAEPRRWVAQEHVELSTTPTLTEHGIEARPSVLRTYTAARGDSYAAMPGGLTRVAPQRDSAAISNQAGAISKDTWVLASEPERLTGFWLQSGPPVLATNPEGSMSARAAENLFWLGRYAERAEGLVRVLRAVGDRRNEFQHSASDAGSECLEVLLRTLTEVTATWPGFAASDPSALADPGDELRSLVVDEHRAGTLAYDARRLLDAAYAVRDQLSNDTWLVIGTLERDLLGSAAATYPRGVGSATLSRVLQALLALAGLQNESMVRDPGWRFMEAGRRLERAIGLVDLLRSTVTTQRSTATDSLVFESVLLAAESIITYRRRYRSHAQLETMLDLLVLDAGNPRGLTYQVQMLTEAVSGLPDGASTMPAAGRMSPAERHTLETLSAVRLADTTALAAVGPDGRRTDLLAFLERLEAGLQAIGAAITAAHFTPLQTQRSLLPSAEPPGPAELDAVFV
jgi:uncharacterized circularly permuted ATP-grasp superfamily protein/uncharacterized alpha-E superfamily protein